MNLSKTDFPDYDKQWNTVKEFEQKGQFKSALEIVNDIALKAEKEGNHPQLIKTFVFKIRYHQILEEDGWVKAIEMAEKEIKLANQPEKSIYFALTADLYQNYLNQNQWRISQLSQVNPLPSDFREWAVDDFRDKIESYMLAAINPEVLKKASTTEYKAILSESRRSEGLRPDLYSIIMAKAQNYFFGIINTSRYSTSISESWIQTTDEFLTQISKSNETTKLDDFALLYADFIASKTSEDQKAVVVDFELQRLNMAHQHLQLSEKYKIALLDLSERAGDHEVWADAQYQLANLALQEKDGLGRLNYNGAEIICNETIERMPKSFGADQCRALLQNTILSSRLELTYESIIPANEAMRVLVNYRNIKKVNLYWSKVESGTEFSSRLRPHHDQLNIKELKWNKINDFSLPNGDDRHEHSIELSADQYPAGEYVIKIVGEDIDGHEIERWNYFHVSDLAFFTAQDNNYASAVVLHRNTGQPLSEVTYRLYETRYNQDKRKNEYHLAFSGKTDKHGEMTIPSGENYKNYAVRLTQNQDDLYVPDANVYRRSRLPEPTEKKGLVIYTDRAIYKPGQTIYFKAVAYKENEYQREALTAKSLTFTLRDVNYQEVVELTQVTNAYGSVQGAFKLPKNVLTGNFTINAGDEPSGQTSISVENYTRPKIEAQFLPVLENYALGDSIHLSLEAATYYGALLQEAHVRFTVKKQTIVPFFARGGFYERCYFPWPREEEVVMTYTTRTNQKGIAELTFLAESKATASYGLRPWESYVVEATVVDETGEPTTAEKTLTLSSSPYRLTAGGSSHFDLSSLEDFVITVENFDGQPAVVPLAEVTLSQLVPNGRESLRARYWSTPSEFYYDSASYKGLFPYDPFKEEHLVVNWPAELVASNNYANESRLSVPLNGVMNPGIYQVVLTVDGEEVYKQFITIFDGKTGDLPSGEKGLQVVQEEVVEAGALNLPFLRGQSEAPLWIKWSQRDSKWLGPNDRSFNLELKESDRQRMNLIYASVYRNRFHSGRYHLPFEYNRDIHLTIEGIEDEVLPGTEVNWEIRTTDSEGQPVSAEVFLSVFDEALDVYKKHNWSASLLNSVYVPDPLSIHSFGFNQKMARWSERRRDYYHFDSRIYPQLLSFYNMGYYRPPQPRMLERQALDGVQMEADATMNKAEGGAEVAEEEKSQIDIRKDLAELAYWNGTLRTDENGRAQVSFSMKEDLTRWRILGLAFDQKMHAGFKEYKMTTKKDFLVQPYVPELLRTGDHSFLSAKVSNQTSFDLQSSISINLKDALSGANLNHYISGNKEMLFSIPATMSSVQRWEIDIPNDAPQLIQYQIVGQAGDLSDGEQGYILIQTDRQKINESHAFFLKPGESIMVDIDDLSLHSPTTSTTNMSLALELVGGPEWYGLQALPYISKVNNESITSLSLAFMGNAMGQKLLADHPWMKEAIKELEKESPLLAKTEFHNIKTQLTPWQREALEEEDGLAMLNNYLDESALRSKLDEICKTIQGRQMSNGGFSWLPGGRDNWYISEMVFDRLSMAQIEGETGCLTDEDMRKLDQYNVNRLEDYYQDLLKNGFNKKEYQPSTQIIQHLKTVIYRQFHGKRDALNETEKFFYSKAIENWSKYNLKSQAQVAIMAYWAGNELEVVQEMMKSFKERLIRTDSRGAYWKHSGYHSGSEYYLSTHAILMDLFKAYGEEAIMSELTTYLLQHKRSNRWKDAESSLSAVRALLHTDWDKKGQLPLVVEVNGQRLSMADHKALTLYAKELLDQNAFPGKEAKIKIENPNDKVAWGAFHWSFEDNNDQLSEYQSSELKIRPEYYTEVDAKLEASNQFELGDKLITQLVIESDRPMDFVVIEDDRIAGAHPGLELSGFEYQSGLSFYKSIQPLSNQYFIQHLPRGKYVIQLEQTASHSGDYSGGVTKIQSQYAPEFNSHSRGRRITIETINQDN